MNFLVVISIIKYLRRFGPWTFNIYMYLVLYVAMSLYSINIYVCNNNCMYCTCT